MELQAGPEHGTQPGEDEEEELEDEDVEEEEEEDEDEDEEEDESEEESEEESDEHEWVEQDKDGQEGQARYGQEEQDEDGQNNDQVEDEDEDDNVPLTTYRPPNIKLGRHPLSGLPFEIRLQIYAEMKPEVPAAMDFSDYIALRKIEGWNRRSQPKAHEDNHPESLTVWTAEHLFYGPWRVHFAEPVKPASVYATNLSAYEAESYVQYKYRYHGGRGSLITPATHAELHFEARDSHASHIIRDALVGIVIDQQNFHLPRFGYGYVALQKEIRRMFIHVDLPRIVASEHPSPLLTLAAELARMLQRCIKLEEVVIHFEDTMREAGRSSWASFQNAHPMLERLAQILLPRPPIDLIELQLTCRIRYTIWETERQLESAHIEFAKIPGRDQYRWRSSRVECLGRHEPEDMAETVGGLCLIEEWSDLRRDGER